MIQDYILSQRGGKIWDQKPSIERSGLLCRFEGDGFPSQLEPSGATLISFNKKGDKLAFCDDRGYIFVFHLPRNRYELVFRFGSRPVTLAFSKYRASELLISFRDATVRCFDIDSKEVVGTLKGHLQAPTFISFHEETSSRNLVLTSSSDAVFLWDSMSWLRVRALSGMVGIVQGLFTPVGGLIVVAFRNDTLISWDSGSLEVRNKLHLPKEEKTAHLQSITSNAQGTLLVASTDVSSLYVWSLESGRLLQIIDLPWGVKESFQISFVGRRREVALLCDDGNVYFVSVGQSHPRVGLLVLPPPEENMLAFALTPNGTLMASLDNAAGLSLYDLTVARSFYQRTRASSELQLQVRGPFGPSTEIWMNEDDIEDERGRLLASKMPRSQLIDSIFRDIEGELDPNQAIGINRQGKPMKAGRRGASDHQIKRNIASKLGEQGRAPLYKLDQMNPREKQVSMTRLQRLLEVYGEYPHKYRLLIWKFLLQLPENHEAFGNLVAKGIHPAFETLGQRYPIQDSRLFRRLQRILSALAHWQPVFGEIPYLPALAFPFVKLYENDDLSAFETIVCVFVHVGKDWLQSIPHPPVAVLVTLERLLEHHDPKLHAHLVELKVSSQEYGWSLLRSGFTEVLGRSDWLTLWDHLFTRFREPDLILFAVVAYLRTFRSSLLEAKSYQHLDDFFHRQNALGIDKLISIMHKLKQDTPIDMLISTTPVDLKQPSPVIGSADAIATEDVNLITSFWPLKSGEYPPFDRYPKFVVDIQIAERERMAQEESEVKKRGLLLQQLEAKVARLEEQEKVWKEQQRKLVQAEEHRRKEAAEQEAQRLEALRRLEEKTRKRRIDQLKKLEETAKETLDQQLELRTLELARLKEDINRKKEKEEFDIRNKGEEEALQKLEFEVLQRVTKIREDRDLEDQMRSLRAEVQAREQKMDLMDKMEKENWMVEDEARKLKWQAELELRERKAKVEEDQRAQREVRLQLELKEIEKDQQKAALARERRLRQIKEEEQMRIAKQADIERKQQSYLQREEEILIRKLRADELKWREERLAKRMEILEEARRQQALESEKRETRMKELEKRQRQLQIEEKLAGLREKEAAAIRSEEAEIQSVLLQIEEARKKAKEDELKRLLEEQEIKEKMAFERVLKETEAEVVHEERTKWEARKSELEQHSEKARQDLLYEHEGRMAKRVLEREKELMARLAAAKKDTRLDMAATHLAGIEPETQATTEFDRVEEGKEAVEEAESELYDTVHEDEITMQARELIRRHKARMAVEQASAERSSGDSGLLSS